MKMNMPVAVYEKTADVTVKRIKHRINFHQGESLVDLISTMKCIKASGAIEIDEFGSYDDTETWGWIEFHEEFVVRDGEK